MPSGSRGVAGGQLKSTDEARAATVGDMQSGCNQWTQGDGMAMPYAGLRVLIGRRGDHGYGGGLGRPGKGGHELKSTDAARAATVGDMQSGSHQ